MIMCWDVGDACYVAMLTTTPPVHTISLSTAMTKTEFLVPKEKVFETKKKMLPLTWHHSGSVDDQMITVQ